MKPAPFIAALGVAIALAGCASTSRGPAPSVSFIEPADGALLTSPFKLRFAVSGMALSVSGDMTPNSGHHHLLVNKESVQEGRTIGFLDFEEIHFTRGQSETRLDLPPGAYQLTLQFANGAHRSYGVAMSRTINVTVK